MKDMFEKYLPAESSDGSAHSDSEVGGAEKTKDTSTQTFIDVAIQTDE